MKFFSGSLLALLFTSAMANVIINPSINFASYAFGGSLDSLIENTTSFAITNTAVTECQKTVLEKYNTCLNLLALAYLNIDEDITKYSEVCPVYEDSNCTAMIKEEINLPDDCNGKEVELKQSFEYFRYLYYLSCAKNEQGEYCPITKGVVNNEQLSDAQVMEQTCSSKSCTEAMDKMVSYLPSISKLAESKGKTLPDETEALKNLKCEEKSGATTKVLGFQVLSLALSLYAMMMVLF